MKGEWEDATYEIEFDHTTGLYDVKTIATGRWIKSFKSWFEAHKFICKELGGY